MNEQVKSSSNEGTDNQFLRIALPLVLGITMTILHFELSSYLEPQPKIILKLLIVLSFLIGFYLLIISYLRGELDHISYSNKNIPEISSISEISNNIKELQIAYKQILEIPSSKGADTKTLIDSLSTQVIKDISGKVSLDLQNKYAYEAAEESQKNIIRINLENAYGRILTAVTDANRRSSTNLIIGILTTALALSLLILTLVENKQGFETVPSLLTHFIPRITTVIFIEIFAFFFLRLYKAGLEEMRYFQNEMTNLQLQQVAIEAAFLKNHNKPLEAVIDQLIKTERNNKVTIGAGDENNLSTKELTTILETVIKATSKS